MVKQQRKPRRYFWRPVFTSWERGISVGAEVALVREPGTTGTVIDVCEGSAYCWQVHYGSTREWCKPLELVALTRAPRESGYPLEGVSA